MKRLLILFAAVAVGGGMAAAALADHKPGHPAKAPKAATTAKGKANAKAKPAKVTICHRTMAGEDAHRTIRISERAWPAHQRHGDSAGACDGENEPQGTAALESTLAPVPNATGAGSFHVDVRLLKNRARLCYTLTATGFDATAAHIHTFAPQDYATAADVGAGGIVVPLKTPTGQTARGCASVPREVAIDIRDNPGEYYVNVHSAAFPGGQIQGTLATAS